MDDDLSEHDDEDVSEPLQGVSVNKGGGDALVVARLLARVPAYLHAVGQDKLNRWEKTLISVAVPSGDEKLFNQCIYNLRKKIRSYTISQSLPTLPPAATSSITRKRKRGEPEAASFTFSALELMTVDDDGAVGGGYGSDASGLLEATAPFFFPFLSQSDALSTTCCSKRMRATSTNAIAATDSFTNITGLIRYSRKSRAEAIGDSGTVTILLSSSPLSLFTTRVCQTGSCRISPTLLNTNSKPSLFYSIFFRPIMPSSGLV